MRDNLIWSLCFAFVINCTRAEIERTSSVSEKRENDGVTTFKRIDSNQIMSSIQMGLEHSIKYISSDPKCDFLMPDFTRIEAVAFPSTGTDQTPSHTYSNFTFKTYASVIFARLRNIYGIDSNTYMKSFCSAPLRELSNPGSSGSLFYITNDDKFIMKTIQAKESSFLLKLLMGYYLNLKQNPKTLLPKFYGHYRYQSFPIDVSTNKPTIQQMKNIRVITMNNLLPSNIKIHQKYDLKGSTDKRFASETELQKVSPTYKDLDFKDHHPNGIFLEPDSYTLLMDILQRDCRVLESFEIMDYSILIGVHNIDLAEQEGKNQNEAQSVYVIPNKGLRAFNGKGERLLLFIGIIDVLQHYDFAKLLEHTYKATVQDGDQVSVHKPDFYAARFLEFMETKVFKKGTSHPKEPSTEYKDASLNTGSSKRINDCASFSSKDSSFEKNTTTGEELEERKVGIHGGTSNRVISTDQVMGSIQMGIQHAVTHGVETRYADLLIKDFMTIKAITFPCDGSDTTPTHQFPQFTFKSFAPIIFQHFRCTHGVNSDDYLQSISMLRELSNSGASGSLFYITQDDKYIIKTVQRGESAFLEEILPGYFFNLDQNPKTLLPKFYGHYRYQTSLNYTLTTSDNEKIMKNIRLIVMNNILPTNIKIHEKYDLKGSTLNRRASEYEKQKKSPTYKDLDFNDFQPNGIYLNPDAYSELLDILRRDCRVLESFKIIDYSLLMGIHYVNRDRKIEKDPNGQELNNVVGVENGKSPLTGIPAINGNGEKLLLFVGIIDVLQNFRLVKKLEHYYKASLYDGSTVSVHNPNFYANRFMNFMSDSVFKKTLDNPSRTSSFEETDNCRISDSNRQKWQLNNVLPWDE